MPIAPGPQLARVVQTMLWITRPEALMRDWSEKYGDAFTVRFSGLGDWTFLSNPAHVKEVFTGDPKLLHAGEGYQLMEPLVGPKSVLLLDEAPHLKQRRLLLPPFHGERMKAYAVAMKAIADEEIDAWKDGAPFALHPRMQEVTLQIILRTVFGLDEGASHGELAGKLVKMLDTASGLLILFPTARIDLGRLSPWGRFLAVRKEVDAILYAEIAKRRKTPAKELEGKGDILSLLLQAKYEDGASMTDEELRDELMTMLFAGHETTATAIAWTMARILHEKDVHSKLEKELQTVMGKELDAAKIEKLVLLDSVIKESLRLHPIVPMIGRQLKEKATIAGFDFPEGAVLAPCPWLVHRRAELYSDPETFVAERFVGKKNEPYEWFPFGGGTRRCIGMAFALYEMKIVLAEILIRSDLVLEKNEVPRTARRGVILGPADGTRVVLRARR